MKFGDNEKNQDFGVSCVRVNPEVNDLNFDETSRLQYHNAMNISNKGSTVNKESSIDTSDMRENILVLPVPKNNQPLPQDQWHKVEDIYKNIK